MATNGELDFEKGSSPQVRGTSSGEDRVLLGSGIIPAGAGHFMQAMAIEAGKRDHPRRCGALVSRVY